MLTPPKILPAFSTEKAGFSTAHIQPIFLGIKWMNECRSLYLFVAKIAIFVVKTMFTTLSITWDMDD